MAIKIVAVKKGRNSRMDTDLICWLLISWLIWNFLSIYLYDKYGFMKWFYHDILGWCESEETIYLAGINLKSKCKYCGKTILQDSQGGWFPVGYEGKN